MANQNEVMRVTGSCLCGAVRFSVHGPMREVVYCHCAMCRRASSHYVAYTACAPDALEIADRRKVKWYKSSPSARRGFCKDCGSQLFWEPAHGRHLSISAGSLDQPTGLRSGKHTHTEYAPDYEQAER